jgi:Flp pilus assembly protein TadG
MATRPHIAKRRSFAQRLIRDQRGATAVEFAFVAAPFLALIAAILELGMFFMGSVSLDNAMQTASRKIRTGEVRTPQGDSTAVEAGRIAFRDAVCANMGFMASDCTSKLTIDVRTAAQFKDISIDDPVENGTFNPGALQFNTGARETIVVVTAYYRWKMFFPTINQALQRLPGEALMTSAITFQNEPF